MLNAPNKKSSEAVKQCCNTLAHEAGEKLRDLQDNAKDDAREIAAAVIKEIRAKPVQSGLIAAGIGFLAGLLLKR